MIELEKGKISSINLKTNSNKELFLIHGYTGSPTDFNSSIYKLSKIFNMNVKVPLLCGHGGRVSDLDNIDYNHFLIQLENEIKKDIGEGKKIIIGGFSLGGIIALSLAAKYPVDGVFSISMPYKLKFPLNIKILESLKIFKKYWKKIVRKEEKDTRRGAVYYDEMHINVLKIIRDAREEIEEKCINKLSCKCLLIHSTNDKIGDYRSVKDLFDRIPSKEKKIKIFDNSHHNIFYSSYEEKALEEIKTFFYNF